MNMKLYLFSIMDNIHGVAELISGLAFICCVVIISGMVMTDDDDSTIIVQKLLGMFIGIMLSAGLVYVLVPTQNSLIKAYMIQEGAVIVNADNAEKIIKNIDKKADELIKAISEK